MAKWTANLTTAAPKQLLCNIDRRRSDANNWIATAFFGVGAPTSFGGATVALQYSPDQGTTLFTGKDYTGNAMTATAAGEVTTQPMGNGSSLGDFIQVYAVLTVVGTAAVVPVVLFDNR